MYAQVTGELFFNMSINHINWNEYKLIDLVQRCQLRELVVDVKFPLYDNLNILLCHLYVIVRKQYGITPFLIY